MNNKVTLENRLAVRNKLSEIPQLYQDWKKLLFLHWAYDPEFIQKSLPEGIFVDTFEGKAYLSVVAFLIENQRLFNLPSLPGFSNYIEVNVRTYVYDKNGIPGVWFYSLDINSILAQEVGRRWYCLNYYFNRLKFTDKNVITGKRFRDPSVSFHLEFQHENDFHVTDPQSLEFFLIERYLFFTYRNGIKIGHVHHDPYQIADATLNNWNKDSVKIPGFVFQQHTPDLVHYSPGVNVDIYKLKKRT